MKLEFQAKLLQHLNKKKGSEEGFTLIELLVVIIIIGILAAIALPSFLNQANKAKQAEAKTYVGSMNRAQQAFYLENNYMTAFTVTSEGDGFAQLGLGIATKTVNFTYSMAGGAKEAPDKVAIGDPSAKVTNQAQPRSASLKAYIGGVSLGSVATTSEATTLAVLCEAKIASGLTGGQDGTQEAEFDGTTGEPKCPDAGYKPVGGKTSAN